MKSLHLLESPALRLVREEWNAGATSGTTDRETALAEELTKAVGLLRTCVAALRDLTSNDAVYDDATGKSLSFALLDNYTGVAHIAAAEKTAQALAEQAHNARIIADAVRDRDWATLLELSR